MMRLYLIRHGEAQPAQIDPERRLTPRGEDDVRRMAAFLAGLWLSVRSVWHSGKPRARQTAELVGAALGPDSRVKAHEGLAPLDDVAPTAARLARRKEDLLIAGHMPFLSRLATLLLVGQDGEILDLKTAAACCLQRSDDGAWQLLWMLSPQCLGGT